MSYAGFRKERFPQESRIKCRCGAGFKMRIPTVILLALKIQVQKIAHLLPSGAPEKKQRLSFLRLGSIEKILREFKASF
jgi:hypothetical protein